MPRRIKYNADGTETNSIVKGGFAYAIQDAGKGPSSVTGFYGVIDTPADGWSIFTPGSPKPHQRIAADDAELLWLVDKIGGDNSSVEAAIAWGQSNDVLIVAGDNKPNYGDNYKQGVGVYTQFEPGTAIFKMSAGASVLPFIITIAPEWEGDAPFIMPDIENSVHSFLTYAAEGIAFQQPWAEFSNMQQAADAAVTRAGMFADMGMIQSIELVVSFSSPQIEAWWWHYTGLRRFTEAQADWYNWASDQIFQEYGERPSYFGPPITYSARIPWEYPPGDDWTITAPIGAPFTPSQNSGLVSLPSSGPWYFGLSQTQGLEPWEQSGLGLPIVQYLDPWMTPFGISEYEVLDWGDVTPTSFQWTADTVASPKLVNHDWSKLANWDFLKLSEFLILVYPWFEGQYVAMAPTDEQMITIINAWADQIPLQPNPPEAPPEYREPDGSHPMWQYGEVYVNDTSYVQTACADSLDLMSRFGVYFSINSRNW